MIKKITAVVLTSLFCFLCFAGCGKTKVETGKLNVVCTLFPQYDWVRNIVGENIDNINLSLLLDSGTDLHSYQPTAQDVVTISKADIFVYVGGESDVWVDGTLKAGKNSKTKIVNMMECLGNDVYKVEPAAGAGARAHEHEEDSGRRHIYDEHIWLSPKKALVICEKIKDALCETDAEHKELYEKNFNEYKRQLDGLDRDIAKTVSEAERDTVLFADRFPFIYLMNDYGIKHYAAFSGCSAESEASFETISFLAKKTDELALPVILITETGDGTIADTVKNNTKTKTQKILVMDALQSVTAAKLDASYIEVMRKNLAVLEQALN